MLIGPRALVAALLTTLAAGCTSASSPRSPVSSPPAVERWRLEATLRVPGTGGNRQRVDYVAALRVDGDRVLQEGRGRGELHGASQCREDGARLGPRQRWSGSFAFGVDGRREDGRVRLRILTGPIRPTVAPRHPDPLCRRLVESHARLVGRLAELRDRALDVRPGETARFPVVAGTLEADLSVTLHVLHREGDES